MTSNNLLRKMRNPKLINVTTYCELDLPINKIGNEEENDDWSTTSDMSGKPMFKQHTTKT